MAFSGLKIDLTRFEFPKVARLDSNTQIAANWVDRSLVGQRPFPGLKKADRIDLFCLAEIGEGFALGRD